MKGQVCLALHICADGMWHYVMIAAQNKSVFLCFHCYRWCTSYNYICQNPSNKHLLLCGRESKSVISTQSQPHIARENFTWSYVRMHELATNLNQAIWLFVPDSHNLAQVCDARQTRPIIRSQGWPCQTSHQHWWIFKWEFYPYNSVMSGIKCPLEYYQV